MSAKALDYGVVDPLTCKEFNIHLCQSQEPQAAVRVAPGVWNNDLMARPQHSGQSAAFLQLKPDPPEGSQPDTHLQAQASERVKWYLQTRCNSELLDILKTPAMTPQSPDRDEPWERKHRAFVPRIYLQMFSGEQSTSLVPTRLCTQPTCTGLGTPGAPLLWSEAANAKGLHAN